MDKKGSRDVIQLGQSTAEVVRLAFARKPRQTRGRVRVEVILDAASALIVEEGVAAMTMHSVAKRAQTSVGSMYYFFPDRGSLLRELVDRHAASTREIERDLTSVPMSVWRNFSVTEAVERLVTAHVDYLRRHRDFLPLICGQTLPESSLSLIHAMAYVLGARLPTLKTSVLDAHAAMLYAMAVGTLQTAFQLAPERTDFFLGEIPRAMTAYLADIESSVGV